MLQRVSAYWQRYMRQPSSLKSAFLVRRLHFSFPRLLMLRLLHKATNVDAQELRRYCGEETGTKETLRWKIDSEVREVFRTYHGAYRFVVGGVTHDEGLFLYVLVRALKPRVAVETGIANGFSSAYILQAMERNGDGDLFSIDLPYTTATNEKRPVPMFHDTAIKTSDWTPIPPGKEAGWLVPGHLRHRWHQIFGDAKVELPSILKTVPKIDLFLHDSLHTYEHMLFEFSTAYSSLRSGGVLVSDDIYLRHHAAFLDFAATVSRRFFTFQNFGLLVK